MSEADGGSRRRRRRRRGGPGGGDGPRPHRDPAGDRPAPTDEEREAARQRLRAMRPTVAEPRSTVPPRSEEAATTRSGSSTAGGRAAASSRGSVGTAARPRETIAASGDRPPDAAIDDGWGIPAPAPPRERHAVTLPPPGAAPAWGDDGDAPTPTIALAADLPADPPAGEPDPSSAPLQDAAPGDDPFRAAPLCDAVAIKFGPAGKLYLYEAGDEAYAVGEQVVVEAERGGLRIGTVAVAAARRPSERGPLRRVLRRPGRGDLALLERNADRARQVHAHARRIARDLGLPIKVFRVELGLSGGRATVYFSSDDKVDFRRLLRDLGAATGLRLELRQTGVRDEAKMVGGIGSCGQELCCSTWLPAFVPVSIKNAKDQGLVLNPTKVSGQCGRLKCCLVYEQATYAEMRKGLPKLGKRVVTADGEGRVVEVDVLRQRIRVSLVHGEFKVYGAGQVQPMFPPQQPGGGRAPDAAGYAPDVPPEPEPS